MQAFASAWVYLFVHTHICFPVPCYSYFLTLDTYYRFLCIVIYRSAMFKKVTARYPIVPMSVIYSVRPSIFITHLDYSQAFTITFQEISHGPFQEVWPHTKWLYRFLRFYFFNLLIGDNSSTYLRQTLLIAYPATISSFLSVNILTLSWWPYNMLR